MKSLPCEVILLALCKSDTEPLTNDERKVCEEWTSGEAMEIMKVDIGDPRLLEYAGLYERLESKKQSVWDERIAGSVNDTH